MQTRLTRRERAVLKLIDEAERTWLALNDGPLPQGKYPHLERAINAAKAALLKNESEAIMSDKKGAGSTGTTTGTKDTGNNPRESDPAQEPDPSEPTPTYREEKK